MHLYVQHTTYTRPTKLTPTSTTYKQSHNTQAAIDTQTYTHDPTLFIQFIHSFRNHFWPFNSHTRAHYFDSHLNNETNNLHFSFNQYSMHELFLVLLPASSLYNIFKFRILVTSL